MRGKRVGLGGNILRKEKGSVMAYSENLWIEAKKKCRLNAEEIQMAKEIGINPKSLIKNILNKNEQWK
uniref:hypothetical protein n=1 Tax=Enterocloster clostridioformis TaxID=1531 RepID=UPI0025A52CFB|nr:hypothetical protein [Enterocloster clostridioformis]